MKENITEERNVTRKKIYSSVIRKLTLAIAFSYLPITLIIAAVVDDNGLISTNYAFRLLALILYTFPLVTALVHWGFTASFALEGAFPTAKEKLTDAIGCAFSIAAIITYIIGSELLYLSLIFTLFSIILRLIEKKLFDLTANVKNEIKHRSFVFLLIGMLVAALITTLATAKLSDNKNKPDPDAPTISTSAKEIFI